VNLAAKFVTHDAFAAQGAQLHRMQIGSANAAVVDLEDDLAGTRLGYRGIDDADLVLFLERGCFHQWLFCSISSIL
jgi:hypothetical protein